MVLACGLSLNARHLRLLFLMRWPCSLASDLGSRTRLLAPMYHSDVQV